MRAGVERLVAVGARPVLFVACAAPLAALLWRALTDALGADPNMAVVRETGLWGLRMLLVTLCVSPLRRLTGRSSLLRYRRMLGLFALFYASVHLLCWMAFLLGFDFADMLGELARRPFITLGFLAWLVMLALGATSNRAAIRRLGARWQTLHRLVYVVGVLGLAHLWWLSRVADKPLLYTAMFVALMAFRWPRRRARRAAAR